MVHPILEKRIRLLYLFPRPWGVLTMQSRPFIWMSLLAFFLALIVLSGPTAFFNEHQGVPSRLSEGSSGQITISGIDDIV